ncbi:MAG: 7-carboxy-7-deazaguanine synthase QueE [Magnetococcus sp. YQC-5]
MCAQLSKKMITPGHKPSAKDVVAIEDYHVMTGASVQHYPICELFASIQGEGSWTGRPMIFIRVWGCPLSCPWCDEPRHRDPDTRQWLTSQEILEQIANIAPDIPYIVLTGGEPLAVEGIQDLILALKHQGYWVAMESSGEGGPLPASGLDWLTLSPKTTAPETTFLAANEIKYVLAAEGGSTAAILARAQRHPNVWVQPRATGSIPDPQAVRRCVALVLASKGRLRLSLQTHKYLGIP